MRRIVSLGLITLTAFFMSGCDFLEDVEGDDLPGIELTGDSVIEVLQYSEFVDPGVQILGDFDLEVVSESDVDTSILGDYTITYTITYLTIEYTVNRTVRVVVELSGITPTLEFVGDIVMEVIQYSVFVDPGIEILGDFDLDITVVSDVDTSIVGTYTITYTVTYLEVDYSVSRTVEVVMEIVIDDPINFSINLTEGVITYTSITVNLTVEDSEGVLRQRYVRLFKDDVEVQYLEYVVGVNEITFTGLDQDSTYKVVIAGEYLDEDTTELLTGYELELTTLKYGTMAFNFLEYVVDDYQIESGFEIIDEDSLVTMVRVYLYKDDVMVEYFQLLQEDSSILFDELLDNTEYVIKVIYTYVPYGEIEPVTMVVGSMTFTTLETPGDPELNVTSHNCDIYEDEIDCTFSLNNIGFNDLYLYAELYEDGSYLEDYDIWTDSFYYFYDLDSETEYTIYLYADFTYGGVTYYDQLIGTYVYNTLEATVYYPPVIEDVVITRTATTVTVEFTLTDAQGTMDRGYIRLFSGSSSKGSFDLVEGHNSVTFDSYIYENTLYTVKIDADYMGNGIYTNVFEEEVHTPPVITLNTFEQTEMFYENDYIIMKLDIDNDEEVVIDFVTINGFRYNTFRFPTDIDTLYVDMGVQSSAGNYVMNLENVGITLNGEEYLVVLTASDDVSVNLVGSIVPSDATVTVIDIISEEHFVYIDNDNPATTSGVNISIYLENKYNLPVSSITIGGVTYTGLDLTVISPTELLVTALFSYDGTHSNNNIYFYEIIFERNGNIISNNQSDPVDVYIYESFNYDWDTDTAEVVHISTPEDLMNIESSSAHPQVMYILDNDIDMSGYNFIPIGTIDNYFTGVFNGNGYTISNVSISKTFGTDNGTEYVGLFGYSKGYIFDLNLMNVNVNVTTTFDNYLYVGILAGKQEADVYNVNIYNSSIVIDGIIAGVVGGMAGQQHGDIIWSSADTDIVITMSGEGTTSSRLYVGGLVGNKPYEDVRSSFASGDITVTSPTLRTVFTGGLLGYIYNPSGSSSPSYVINSYATGDISVETDYYGRTGGLIGDTYMNRYDIIILNSFATGDVNTYAGTTGGLVGETWTEINSSFAIGTINGTNGTVARLFGEGNDYALVNIYAYDAQVVTRGLSSTGGSDIYYNNIGIATAVEFNDVNYYINHLGWNHHFFDFSNLDIENGLMPTLK